MEQLENLESLVIHQKKEIGEVITSLETKNKYTISDSSGVPVSIATEEGGNVFMRMFLKAARPFTMNVYNFDRSLMMQLVRPFRFIFSIIHVESANQMRLGYVERKFSVFSKQYRVYSSSDIELFEIYGPLFHPWTFKIIREGRIVGTITKKWSGLVKESITDADNFGIQFPQGASVSEKALLLGAMFLIDFCHFEK